MAVGWRPVARERDARRDRSRRHRARGRATVSARARASSSRGRGSRPRPPRRHVLVAERSGRGAAASRRAGSRRSVRSSRTTSAGSGAPLDHDDARAVVGEHRAVGEVAPRGRSIATSAPVRASGAAAGAGRPRPDATAGVDGGGPAKRGSSAVPEDLGAPTSITSARRRRRAEQRLAGQRPGRVAARARTAIAGSARTRATRPRRPGSTPARRDAPGPRRARASIARRSASASCPARPREQRGRGSRGRRAGPPGAGRAGRGSSRSVVGQLAPAARRTPRASAHAARTRTRSPCARRPGRDDLRADVRGARRERRPRPRWCEVAPPPAGSADRARARGTRRRRPRSAAPARRAARRPSR